VTLAETVQVTADMRQKAIYVVVCERGGSTFCRVPVVTLRTVNPASIRLDAVVLSSIAIICQSCEIDHPVAAKCTA
jgi:hypothetical protein